MKKLLTSIAGFLLAMLSVTGKESNSVQSPYGICTHVSRGEFQVADQEMQIMEKNGIGWVRTDFDWKTVETSPGQWNFSRFDAVVAKGNKFGVKIAPILDYDVKWATPAFKHMDKWLNYVNRTVTRYKSDIRYWEVWNEQNNAGMWRSKPNAKDYMHLVKGTYQKIKEINPELTVVLGGFAGIPMSFIEDIFKAGNDKYFDVLNIHPYCFPYAPETSMYEDVMRLKKLMKKYNVEKELFITEMGFPTHIPADVTGVIKQSLIALEVKTDKIKVATLIDPEWRYGHQAMKAEVSGIFSDSKGVTQLTMKQFSRITPSKYQVVMLPAEESFPMKYFSALENYVKHGGIVIFSKGVPLYYNLKKQTDGTVEKVAAGNHFQNRLHLGWEAWWTRKGVPSGTVSAHPADGFKDKLNIKSMRAGIYITGKGLKQGDKMIPVIYGTKGKFKGCVAAAYKLNSDLKGGVVVLSSNFISGGVTPEVQAEMLPRAYLMGFQAGVKRIFWYELQSPGGPDYDRESHFGILNQDLSPKPGIKAYGTLTKMRPAGSQNQKIYRTRNHIYLASWQKPDNSKVWAVWSISNNKPCILNIRGKISGAINHLGKNIDMKGNGGKIKLNATPGIIYITGPKAVSLQNSLLMK